MVYDIVGFKTPILTADVTQAGNEEETDTAVTYVENLRKLSFSTEKLPTIEEMAERFRSTPEEQRFKEVVGIIEDEVFSRTEEKPILDHIYKGQDVKTSDGTRKSVTFSEEGVLLPAALIQSVSRGGSHSAGRLDL